MPCDEYASPPLRVAPDDPEYRRQAAAEAAYWHDVHPLGLETVESLWGDGAVGRYINARFTDEAGIDWVATIARWGRFRRGLILGISSPRRETRLLETNTSLCVTLLDISAGGVERRARQLGAAFPGRVSTAIADLNFVELPAESYDVVVSSSTIHHVTNLEHLAFQINRALTSDGFFFLEDYVGEPRFQFCAAKRRLFELLYQQDLARQRGRKPGLTWLDASDLSPFCGVRSDDILDVFRGYLDEIHMRTAGALLIPMPRTRPVDVEEVWARVPRWKFMLAAMRQKLGLRPKQLPIDPGFLAQLGVVGDTASDAGLIPPGVAFAVYRKRNADRTTPSAALP